jgi:hypothetical protein
MKPRFHEEDDLEFNPDDFDTIPAANFDFADEFEPIEKEEPEYGSGDEAELKSLQAKLRELPKGHPMKKDLAIKILDLHKKLSAEDTGYNSRREQAEVKAQRANQKKQQWIDSVVDDEPSYNGFESRRVMKCSDFIILEKKRAEVLKDADKKFPNLKKAEMKKMLRDQEAGSKDFKQKSKKYFGWAKDPEAAAAAFIRKATGKEPKDL